MPPSPKEMKLPKSGDEICVVTKTYRSIHPPKIGTMNESLRNIWLKVGFFPQGADGDANTKSEKVIPSSVNFSNLEVHLSYKRCNLHSSMFNDIQFELVVWKSLELILLEFVGIAFSKKKMFLQSMKEDFQRAHPNLTRKPTAENLKSPTPLSILPNSSWTFQPPPPQEQAKEPELTCCSRLWSSSSPAGTGCFPGKIYGLHLFKAQFVHKHWRTATTLLWSQRRSCLPVVNVFWFLWSFRSSGQWLEELKILKYLVHTYIIMYEYKYIYICIYVCVRPGDVHTHMAKPKKMNFA